MVGYSPLNCCSSTQIGYFVLLSPIKFDRSYARQSREIFYRQYARLPEVSCSSTRRHAVRDTIGDQSSHYFSRGSVILAIYKTRSYFHTWGFAQIPPPIAKCPCASMKRRNLGSLAQLSPFPLLWLISERAAIASTCVSKTHQLTTDMIIKFIIKDEPALARCAHAVKLYYPRRSVCNVVALIAWIFNNMNGLPQKRGEAGKPHPVFIGNYEWTRTRSIVTFLIPFIGKFLIARLPGWSCCGVLLLVLNGEELPLGGKCCD